MKLYEVEITVRAVIVADDYEDAVSVANDQAREILREDTLDDVEVVGEIRALDKLPADWTDRCIPYGGDDFKTIGQIFAELPPQATPDTKTLDMFAEATP